MSLVVISITTSEVADPAASVTSSDIHYNPARRYSVSAPQRDKYCFVKIEEDSYDSNTSKEVAVVFVLLCCTCVC